jgi:hypothetical protein
MDGKKPDSSVVELILAVDLDPTNPEEPLNIGDVKVAPKGGEDATDSKLVDQLLAAIAKIDPDLSYIVRENEGNPRAAVRAIEKHAEKAPEDAQDEGDSFDKAQAKKPGRSPQERYGHPEPKPEPKKDFGDEGDFEPRPKKPRFDDEGDGFRPKKRFGGGGFKGASDRAFGKDPRNDFEPDEKDDEEGEQPFKKKEW